MIFHEKAEIILSLKYFNGKKNISADYWEIKKNYNFACSDFIGHVI